MTLYCVNATKTVAAWLYVEADSPEEAEADAATRRAYEFEHDDGTAEIEFNVTPAVEVAE